MSQWANSENCRDQTNECNFIKLGIDIAEVDNHTEFKVRDEGQSYKKHNLNADKNLMSMIETKHLATSTSVVSDCSVTSAGSSARIHSILAGFWLSDSTCKAYHNTSTSVVSDCSVTSAGSSAPMHSILAGFWLSDSTCKAYHNTSTSVVSDCSVTSAGSSARIHSILAGFWLSGGDASTMTTPSCGGIIPQFLATLMAVLIISPAISAEIEVHASTTTWMCKILNHLLIKDVYKTLSPPSPTHEYKHDIRPADLNINRDHHAETINLTKSML